MYLAGGGLTSQDEKQANAHYYPLPRAVAQSGMQPPNHKSPPSERPDKSCICTIDPFDGQPLRYVKVPTGFRVYSVGPDRADNAGLLDRPRGGVAPREFDIGFGVERPNR